jgi:DNA-binding transcriptional LysR family regulator
MALQQEQRAALRILEGIEDGTMNATDLLSLVEAADPALVYLIFTWLRKRYADHPNADAVIGRVVEISGRGSVAKMMKEGQADIVVQWFEESHSYRTLEKNEFIELIIEKLEG